MSLNPKNKLITLFQQTLNLSITPNELFAMLCFKEKIMIDHTKINLYFEMRRLKSEGYVTYNEKEEKIVITEKGEALLTEMETLYSKTVESVSKQVIGNNYEENIASYNMLFPRGKLPSGKQARVNAKNLEASFKWFFKNFDYSWEIVLKATELYVNEYRLRNYLYMRTSQYFIRKTLPDRTSESELANYCEMIVTGNYEDPGSEHFSERVV